jgi:hypothetical protein
MSTLPDNGKIQFIYNTDTFDGVRETVITNLTIKARKFLELPPSLEVEFKKLPMHMHAETLLNPRFNNRIRLQDILNSKEVIIPYLHELIHINQVYKKILIPRNNSYVSWKNRLYVIQANQSDPDEWAKLPWEIDVANRLPTLVQNILSA